MIEVRSQKGCKPVVESQDRHANEYRLGVVSYLNAKPLIEGLDGHGNLTLTHAVPANLPGMLESDEVDVALVPVVDLVLPSRSWKIVSDACIGCDGETLTVRIYSNVPPSEIRTLHVDGDSHTSVALAQVIWREQFGQPLNIVPLCDSVDRQSCEAILLIGDKVITSRLPHLEIETDLGGAWKSMTGLPFVFAVWAAKHDLELGELPTLLGAARDAGVRDAARIASDVGPSLGWPIELARRYLTHRLRFTLTARHKEGLSRFVQLAKQHQLVPSTQELEFA
ncbi:MAG: menaquinone biosynthesis protein [Planctomycetes bacterium]|nr:menaquinone biosynthesis protein [Planctomycetota bacterium]